MSDLFTYARLRSIACALLVAVGGFGVTAGPVAALDDACGWTTAGSKDTNQTDLRVVSPNSTFTFEWENSAADGTCDSSQFYVADEATVVCNLDTADTNPPGGSPGVIAVYFCPSTTASATACISTGALDGTEGDASTQSAAVVLGHGRYYLRVTTAVADGDEAICTIYGQRS